MGLVTFSSVSMWLEFTYTGRKADYERFEVLTPPPSHITPSPCTILTRTTQIYRGCIRTTEEVLAESPQLQIMRDPPPLMGKRVRYAMVFHFEEEGQPKQSFMRARSWELPKSLEPWKGRPAGWEAVYEVIQTLFGRIDEVVLVPMDTPVAQ